MRIGTYLTATKEPRDRAKGIAGFFISVATQTILLVVVNPFYEAVANQISKNLRDQRENK